MAGRKKDGIENNFEDLDNADFFQEELEDSDNMSEEVNLDNPNFNGELWDNYIEDLEFEE